MVAWYVLTLLIDLRDRCETSECVIACWGDRMRGSEVLAVYYRICGHVYAHFAQGFRRASHRDPTANDTDTHRFTRRLCACVCMCVCACVCLCIHLCSVIYVCFVHQRLTYCHTDSPCAFLHARNRLFSAATTTITPALSRRPRALEREAAPPPLQGDATATAQVRVGVRVGLG